MEIKTDTFHALKKKWVDGHTFEHMITHKGNTVKYIFDRTVGEINDQVVRDKYDEPPVQLSI